MKRTYSPRIHLRPADDPKPLNQIWQGQTTLEYLNLLGGLTAGQVYHLLLHNRPNRDGVMLSEATNRRNVNRQLLRPLKELQLRHVLSEHIIEARALEKLADVPLVRVKAIGQPDNAPAMWEMNYLTPAGYEVLKDLRQTVHPYRLPQKTITRHKIDYHSIGIRDAAVWAIADGWRNHLQLVSYLDDDLLRQAKLGWPMEPDAILVFRYGSVSRVFFLEIDRGTERGRGNSKTSIENKMRAYNHFMSSQRKDDPWLGQFEQPDVMIITDKPRRLSNLMRIAAERGNRTAYWFAPTEFIAPPYGFFKQVWQRVGLDGYYSPTERFVSQLAS